MTSYSNDRAAWNPLDPHTDILDQSGLEGLWEGAPRQIRKGVLHVRHQRVLDGLHSGQ